MRAANIFVCSILVLMFAASVSTYKKPVIGYEKERPRWEKIVHPYYDVIWLADGRPRSLVWRASEVPNCVWEINLLQKDDNDTETTFYTKILKDKEAQKLPLGRLKIPMTVPREIPTGSYQIGVDCDSEQIELRSETFKIIGHEVYEGEGKAHQHISRAKEYFKKKENQFRNIDLGNLAEVKCTIPILNKPSRLEFDEKCTNKACIIRGVTGHWPAHKKWNVTKMKDDARLSAYGLPIGDSPVRPGLIEELWAHDMSRRYSSQPMVFMRSFLDLYPELRDDYDVPELFREEQDMLNALPHEARLDWHWLIIAPTRSGSYWHIDPVNTPAWNALVSGKKRWATYPPETYYVPGMRHNDLRKQAYGDKEGVDNPYLWFSQTLPYIKPQLKPQECIQQPGDVIFMPEGWWHAVLNVEDTVAVTQNFLRKSARRNTVHLLRQSDHPQTLKALAMKYGDTYPGLFEERDTMDQERLTSDDLKDMAGKIHMVEKLKRLGKSEKELQELMQNK